MSEAKSQSALISWWDIACKGYGLPKFAMYATPNGGSRNVIEATNLKRGGVRRGVPDLTLCVPRNCYHGLYIEMKYAKGKPSAEQHEFLEFLVSQNYRVVVCYDWQAGKAFIEDYLKGN